MKVLFHCHTPFMLAHGGMQTQIEQTKQALEDNDVTVEYLRWWDADQRGDILHFFGRMPPRLIEFAKMQGMRVVQEDLLAAQVARPRWRLALQALVIRVAETGLPPLLTQPFGWGSYQQADTCVVNTACEAELLTQLFRVPPDRVHVLPNGVEPVFFDTPPMPRNDWLVSTATITERKRVLEVARAAIHAKTPIWFIGRPYDASAAYCRDFIALCHQHPHWLRFEGPIADRSAMARVYRSARGFVLLSSMETRSLSAEEAAACECPLLLSDQRWARSVFGATAAYCPVTPQTARTAQHLREFYDHAPQLPQPARPLGWIEVGRQLREIYRNLQPT